MKVQTVEKFIDFLDDSLAWRKQELSYYLLKIDGNQKQSSALIRGGVPLLYAHWEGFIKEAAIGYLYFIDAKKKKINELRENFAAVYSKKRLNELVDSSKASTYVQAIRTIRTNEGHIFSVRPEKFINTQSNLSSKVLIEILITLGLNPDTYAIKQKVIDEKLLKARNEIAHGNYLSINSADYKALHLEVLDMIQTFKTELENAVNTDSYLAE